MAYLHFFAIISLKNFAPLDTSSFSSSPFEGTFMRMADQADLWELASQKSD